MCDSTTNDKRIDNEQLDSGRQHRGVCVFSQPLFLALALAPSLLCPAQFIPALSPVVAASVFLSLSRPLRSWRIVSEPKKDAALKNPCWTLRQLPRLSYIRAPSSH
jgi:hypothetical protein